VRQHDVIQSTGIQDPAQRMAPRADAGRRRVGPAPLHIPCLDGIRALSFLLVFVSHCGLEDLVPGGLGVTAFFFLSGYLITTLMRTEYERNGKVSLKHFWLRRALRILPPFYLVLAFAYALPALSGSFSVATAQALLAQALHVTNFYIINHGYTGFPEHTGTGVYWSLAIEEHFYLVFPFLYIYLRRYGLSPAWQATVLALLCAAALVWRLTLVLGFDAPSTRTYMGSDTRLDSILFGALLAIGANPVLDARRGDEKVWARLLVPVALAVLLASLLIRQEAFRETARYTLQGLAFLILFSAAIRFPQWPIFKWLNSRPLVFIGTLSYSLYLVHLCVLFIVHDLLHVDSLLWRGVLSLAISLAVSWLIYKFVEKPCAALRRRLVD
jgi:peptidoglycan/LPS O-acetylase OafA/YrhL